MNRQLPVVEIEGTAFYVDVLQEVLRQKDEPKNTISFDVFQQDGDGYTFLYDRNRKNVAEDAEDTGPAENQYIWVTLPALMELDPEGIALKYDIPLTVLCPGTTLNDLTEEEEDFL